MSYSVQGIHECHSFFKYLKYASNNNHSHICCLHRIDWLFQSKRKISHKKVVAAVFDVELPVLTCRHILQYTLDMKSMNKSYCITNSRLNIGTGYLLPTMKTVITIYLEYFCWITLTTLTNNGDG